MLRNSDHWKLRRHWKSIAFWAIVALVAWWIVCTSESFQSCIRECDNDKTYNALHESPSIIRRTVIRLDINRSCVGNFVDKNQGSLTVFATFIVALFTFTLWRSTNKLWNAARDQVSAAENAAKIQSADMNRSITTAKQAADAATLSAKAVIETERPYIFISDIQPSIRDAFVEAQAHIAVLQCIIKNYGRTPAIIKGISSQLRLTREQPMNLSPARKMVIILAQYQDHEFVVPDGVGALSEEQIRMIRQSEIHLWLHFSFIY